MSFVKAFIFFLIREGGQQSIDQRDKSIVDATGVVARHHDRQEHTITAGGHDGIFKRGWAYFITRRGGILVGNTKRGTLRLTRLRSKRRVR